METERIFVEYQFVRDILSGATISVRFDFEVPYFIYVWTDQFEFELQFELSEFLEWLETNKLYFIEQNISIELILD